MPKFTDREKLAQQDASLKKLQAQMADTQKRVRSRYADILMEMPIETLSDREFRELIAHAVRAGGGPSLDALKSLPAAV